MRRLIGILFISCQIATGVAGAQVPAPAPEATAEPSAGSAAQHWISQRGTQGDTELHWMAYKGDTAEVRRLLQNGADVNKAVDNGNTPLHLAAYKGHAEVVEVLLEHGAELDARTDAGLTPLDWARRKGHREVERLLLAHRAAGEQAAPEVVAVSPRPATVAKEPMRARESPLEGAVEEGRYQIQLGSFNSRRAAQDTWERCLREYAGALGDRRERIQTVDLRGKVYHRLRTGGFSLDAARGLCAGLKQKGQPCIVVGPE